MASFVVRTLGAAGVDLPARAPDAFADDNGSNHEPAINTLAQLGVVQGDTTGRYDPHRSVSRAQMATYLARAYDVAVGATPTAVNDAFIDDDGNPHEAAIDTVAHLRLATGTGPTTFAPSAPVRRDQMASFLARLLDAALA